MPKKKGRKYDFAAAIQEEFRTCGYRREYRDNHIVGKDFVHKLFNERPKDLRRNLGDDFRKAEPDRQVSAEELDELQDWVTQRSQKLYFILIHLSQSSYIVAAFRDRQIDDDVFLRTRGCTGPMCTVEDLHNTPLHDLSNAIVENQWLLPPVLSDGKHHIFPAELRFPFTKIPVHCGKGAWGQVYQVLIVKAHLEAIGYEKNKPVAYKTVRKEEGISWEKMMREVETLRARKHDNIVPLFASFTAGCEEPLTAGFHEEYLHMLFEFAPAGDMKAWLASNTAPSNLDDKTTRQKFVYSAMQDLASGLAYIHREIRQLICFHHDLKPSNVLLFQQGGKLRWKICDFGKANLKLVEDGTGTRRSKDNEFGTYEYRPPEYFIGQEAGDEDKHGRSFDVYSLGCIYLELVTIVQYGWTQKGLPEFEKQRQENKNHPYNGPDKKTRDISFHNNGIVVESWMDHLENNDSNERVRAILELIKGMFKDRMKRLFAWEIDVDLFRMLNVDASDQEVKGRLEGVIQYAREHLTALDNQHNPLQRAMMMGREQWWLQVLRDHRWSNSQPTMTKQLAERRDREPILVENPCSTLASLEYQEDQMFSRHGIDEQILTGFAKSNWIGLYGKSGVGKSYLAYRHAVKYRDTDQTKERKHTFWVNAKNPSEFRNSIRMIADSIGIKVAEPKEQDGSLLSVMDWLKNGVNGPWIMVLDDLDHENDAKALDKYLPKECGQILITTKNKGVLDHFMRQESCLEVDDLDTKDLRSIFCWYNQDPFITTEHTSSNELLNRLHLPQHVKVVARYLAKYQISASTLYDDLKAGNHEKIRSAFTKDAKDRYPNSANPLADFYAHLLRPLLPTTITAEAHAMISSTWPSDELKLLGELACMSQDVEYDLLESLYKHHALDELLGVLVNCSLIKKNTTGTYIMHESIQNHVRDWVVEDMGPLKLFGLYESVLTMLECYYFRREYNMDTKRTRRRHTLDASVHGAPHYADKLKCMTHFECFLTFVKEHRGIAVDYKVSDEMVEAVHTFSKVYLDDARYEDAASVLDFTFKRYQRPEHRKHYQLGRILVEALLYCSSAKSPARQHIERAEHILKDLLQEAEKYNFEGERLEILRETAHFYNKLKRPDLSFTALDKSRGFRLAVENKLPTVILGRKWQPEPREEKQQDLAIRLCIERARAHLVRARITDRTKPGRQYDVHKTLQGLEDARTAVSFWFGASRAQWQQEIQQERANVLFELGTPDDLHEAEGILCECADEIHKECEKDGRPWCILWDAECKIARVRMHMREEATQEKAIEHLNALLMKYENRYGLIHGHTLRCAEYLAEAYDLKSQTHDAQVVRAKFQLETNREVYKLATGQEVRVDALQMDYGITRADRIQRIVVNYQGLDYDVTSDEPFSYRHGAFWVFLDIESYSSTTYPDD